MVDELRKELKVLFVTESFPPESYGGGEISCALMAEALVEKGLSVTVLTSKVEGLSDLDERNGVKVIRRLKTGKGRQSLKENLKRRMHFKKSVKKEVEKISSRYDLIHFFNITSITDLRPEKPTFATINSYINFCPKGNLYYKEKKVCRGCGFRKFIRCITASDYVGNQKIGKGLRYNPLFWIPLYLDFKRRKRCLKYVDHFFSLSDFITEMLMEEEVPEEDITKVPNVPKIDDSKSGEVIELPGDGIRIVYIGALTKIKGVDLLIEAFDEVEGNAELIIVGDGPDRERLESMAAGTKNIEFLGKVDHSSISYVYEGSDVIVVPSLWPEPLSRVLLEAAYFGKPIIATNVGGNPEVVKPGFNGFLFEPEVSDLTEKLNKIVEKDALRKKFGNNMKKYFRKRFAKEKVLDKVISTYREKVDKKL